jgi:hypothetical protein
MLSHFIRILMGLYNYCIYCQRVNIFDLIKEKNIPYLIIKKIFRLDL